MAYRKKTEILGDKTNGQRRRLTDKQIAFGVHYAATLNGSEAVRVAGYRCKPGNENRMSAELRAHPVLAEFIAEEQEKRRLKADINAQYVIDKLVRIVEDTESGNPQAALRGLELIGKHLGMYRDKTEISGPDGEAIQMEQKVKENVADFTSRIASLAKRRGESNVVEFPEREGDGGA